MMLIGFAGLGMMTYRRNEHRISNRNEPQALLLSCWWTKMQTKAAEQIRGQMIEGIMAWQRGKLLPKAGEYIDRVTTDD